MASKDSKITLFGEGRETRDHVYIEDVARLLVQCLMYRSAGTINAASGEAVTFHDVATRIAGLIGPSIAVEFLPPGGAVTHRQFDVTERVRAFPDFNPTSLDEGLLETLTKVRNP
jgi:nucleoside-diphosphate-sugar epimerase